MDAVVSFGNPHLKIVITIFVEKKIFQNPGIEVA